MPTAVSRVLSKDRLKPQWESWVHKRLFRLE